MAIEVTQHNKLSREEVDDFIQSLSPGDRLAMAALFTAMEQRGLMLNGERRAKIVGPQTDEELLEAVEELTGYHIPRVSVCTEHGHEAPAQTFCDLYFERARNVLWIGNRGGGKTTNSGFLHGAKCYWNPGYSTALAGAMQQQSQRGYAEFKRFTRFIGDAVLDTLMSRTNFANGSLAEVLGGTVKQVNGPHPHFAQFDELELSTLEVFQEFLNMAQGDTAYIAQQLLTSTRKKAHGLVQKVFKESRDAEAEGREAPWSVRIFCIFETLRNQPNCRMAPENQGKPEAELCQCHEVIKGEWLEGEKKGQPRTFADVCNGRAYRADGFVSLDDAHTRFRTLSQMVWESQVECLRPSVEGLVHKWYGERYNLERWLPHPSYGPVYRGWDWGGENPHAIVWMQRLAVDVGMVIADDGTMEPLLDEDDEREIVLTLKAGTFVQFDEIHGNADKLGEFSSLGLRAVLRQMAWWNFGFVFDIAGDFCDPAGMVGKREVKKAIRQLRDALAKGHEAGDALAFLTEEQRALVVDWAKLDADWIQPEWLLEPSFSSRPAPRYESIRKHIELGTDGFIYVVLEMCPRTDDEYDVYHWEDPKPGKNLPEDAAKDDDHAMDAKRYLIWGVTANDGKAPREAPVAVDKPQGVRLGQSPFQMPSTIPAARHENPAIDVSQGLPDHLGGGASLGDFARSGHFASFRSGR